MQEEDRALQKMQRWARARPLWNDDAHTGPGELGENRAMKQGSQLLSVKRALNASMSPPLGNGELLKILERGTDLMKVGVLGRETGQMIKSCGGWRRTI